MSFRLQVRTFLLVSILALIAGLAASEWARTNILSKRCAGKATVESWSRNKLTCGLLPPQARSSRRRTKGRPTQQAQRDGPRSQTTPKSSRKCARAHRPSPHAQVAVVYNQLRRLHARGPAWKVCDAADSTEDSRVVLDVLILLHAPWYCLMVFLVELPGCLFSPCPLQQRRARAETRENLTCTYSIAPVRTLLLGGDSKVSPCPSVGWSLAVAATKL